MKSKKSQDERQNRESLCKKLKGKFTNKLSSKMKRRVNSADEKVVEVTDSAGNVTTYTYSADGKLLRVKDPLNNITSYSYNDLGRCVAVKDALGNTVEYGYDERGRMTTVKDARGNKFTMAYDENGDVIETRDPYGNILKSTKHKCFDPAAASKESEEEHTFNGSSICKYFANFGTPATHLKYDATGRIVGYISPDGSADYKYDANGNVLQVITKKGIVRRTYDALNRITSCTDMNGRVVRYEYDAVGNIVKLKYKDSSEVTYAYDENRNLIRVTDWAGRVTTYTYDAVGNLIGATKPDGSITVNVYDNMQRMTSTVERMASGEIITGFEFKYDDQSRISEEKVLTDSKKLCYEYDKMDRVISRTIKSLEDDSVIRVRNYT